ncbi:MAG: alpha/beta fold hydrolase [Lentisphaeria bacterium]|nr:alpha/beta fold hydrolase [Lentisphaeria bacterium]
MKQELIEEFQRLATSNELSVRLQNNSTFNIETPTFGGNTFWENHEAGKWKLQINIISGWWRILDENNVRKARGTTEEQLENLLRNRPTSAFSNYFDRGYRFAKTAARHRNGRSAILIHGWGVRANSMQELATALSNEGYDAYSFDYPTAERSIGGHVEIFLEQLRELLRTFPESEEIFVLTHSMGGLLFRGALAEMTKEECRRFSGVVMLGPPNRGSLLAYFGKLPVMKDINASLGDMTQEEDSYAMKIPLPKWFPPVGIIAGKYDGKVMEKDTHLPDGIEYSHIVVPCTHPGLRSPQNTLEHIIRFFENKKF